jgi:hypothetical protein
VLSDLHALISNGKKEPLGYALFYEAWNQSSANSRSALVIGIAALETSLKQCLVQSFPDMEPLLMGRRAPSILRLLREYWTRLPKIPKVNGKSFIIPKSILEIVDRGVTMRNRIVHGHEQEMNQTELEELLHAVHDLMRIFDALCGEQWATQYVRPETRSKIVGSDAATGSKRKTET